MTGFVSILKKLLLLTPFEGRKRLPVITLEPVALIFACQEARGKPMTIVQVGACDGTSNDPVWKHAVKGKSRSILLEPNPFAFELLKKAYRGVPNVILLQAAVSDEDGETKLYRVKHSGHDDSEVHTSLQIASFYREHVAKHGVDGKDIEEITVACRSLGSIVRELNIAKIDLLQIDAEGFDAAVVRMSLNLSALPGVINFEHIHLRNADRRPLFDLLEAKDYLLGYDAVNCTAVLRSFMDEVLTARA
jgi:FkbM family methyltransferase